MTILRILGMASILLIFVFLGLVYLSNCGLSDSDDYWINTKDYRYDKDFHTENYTVSGEFIILHGYWFTTSYKYQDDYIINFSDISSIWKGKTQIYPENVLSENSWDNLKNGHIYMRNEIPIWPFLLAISLILVVAFLYLLRQQMKQIVRVIKKRYLSPVGKGYFVNEIKLPRETRGIIATRDWKIKKHGLLCSTWKEQIWDAKKYESDNLPSKDNENGVHAYRLGTNLKRSWGKVSGIVELTGKCIGHTDGLVRAQKCQILMLFCLWPTTARELSARYDVPVMLILDKNSDFERFLISAEGIYWLTHNLNLTNHVDSMEIEIDEIIKKEGF